MFGVSFGLACLWFFLGRLLRLGLLDLVYYFLIFLSLTNFFFYSWHNLYINIQLYYTFGKLLDHKRLKFIYFKYNNKK